MITINVTFTDEEAAKLQQLKDDTNLNWHDFILVSSGAMTIEDIEMESRSRRRMK
jgi:hypothetical protein